MGQGERMFAVGKVSACGVGRILGVRAALPGVMAKE